MPLCAQDASVTHYLSSTLLSSQITSGNVSRLQYNNMTVLEVNARATLLTPKLGTQCDGCQTNPILTNSEPQVKTTTA